MVEADDIYWNEEELEGPVSHDHFPPEVECKVPVICQEVGVSHCAPVNDECKNRDCKHHYPWILAEESWEVSEMMECPGESEAQEEGREVAELHEVNSCHVCAPVANNDALVEVDKCKEGKPYSDVADATKDNEANQSSK